MFNVFNNVIYNNRQAQMQYNSPTDLSLAQLADAGRWQPRPGASGAA